MVAFLPKPPDLPLFLLRTPLSLGSLLKEPFLFFLFSQINPPPHKNNYG
jgi:hypothetical protein